MDVFAERGYFGASMDEIARRSGVTPPVVYDHFASKIELHKRLLERTREELLEMWRTNLAGDDPADVRIPRALDAWARYVEEHPYTARMFFFETTGDVEAAAVHREIQQEARSALAAILATQASAENVAALARGPGARDVRRGPARRARGARNLVAGPPRRAARADRRDGGQRASGSGSSAPGAARPGARRAC